MSHEKTCPGSHTWGRLAVPACIHPYPITVLSFLKDTQTPILRYSDTIYNFAQYVACACVRACMRACCSCVWIGVWAHLCERIIAEVDGLGAMLGGVPAPGFAPEPLLWQAEYGHLVLGVVGQVLVQIRKRVGVLAQTVIYHPQLVPCRELPAHQYTYWVLVVC